MRFLGVAASEREAWPVERGESALDCLEQALAAAFLANQSFSIADIALLACIRAAPENGFAFTGRPAALGLPPLYP